MKMHQITYIIKLEMAKQKITMQDLADQIQIHRATLHRNLAGDTEMPLANFLKIMDVLKQDVQIISRTGKSSADQPS
jgi:AraC-like DNA-binding protein